MARCYTPPPPWFLHSLCNVFPGLTFSMLSTLLLSTSKLMGPSHNISPNRIQHPFQAIFRTQHDSKPCSFSTTTISVFYLR